MDQHVQWHTLVTFSFKKKKFQKLTLSEFLEKDCILQNLFREYGFDRFRILLIEDFPCEDLYLLSQRQRYYIRELKAINKYADDKDYYAKIRSV